MKYPLLFLITIFIATSNSYAQPKVQYFDYKLEETNPDKAIYYATIEQKDSLWQKNTFYIYEKALKSVIRYADSNCVIKHGKITEYHPNGILSVAGNYKQGNKEGIWLGFHPNGILKDSILYEANNPKGIALSWYDDGNLSDSINYDDNGKAVAIQWFQNGNISYAGRYNNYSKKQGKWQFFHTNGIISSEEIYKDDVLIDKKYFNEDGSPQLDTTNKDREAKFVGGDNAFALYVSKSINLQAIETADKKEYVLLKAGFWINEKGVVNNVHSYSKDEPPYTRLYLNMLRSSPKWQPAINHNRKIPFYKRNQLNLDSSRLY